MLPYSTAILDYDTVRYPFARLCEAHLGDLTTLHDERIGRLKVEEMEHYKDPVELDLIRRLKQTFDPTYLLNPGKIVGDR